MDNVSAAEFRKNMAHYLEAIEVNCEELVINRPKGKKSVVLSWDEYQSLQETAYLMSNPKNRKHLLQSLEELKNGKVVPYKLAS